MDALDKLFDLSHGFTAGFCWYVTKHEQPDGYRTRYSYTIEASGSLDFYDENNSDTWWFDELDAAKYAVSHCIQLRDAATALSTLVGGA